MTADCRAFHDIPESAAECSDDVAALLTVLARGYCVESGTFMGKGARALAVGAEQVDTVDPCFDCWQGRAELPANVQTHLCRGVDFTPTAPVDVLFIDSGRTCRDEDLEHLAQFLAPGGLVVVDDAPLVAQLTLRPFRQVTLPFDNEVVLCSEAV